MMRTTAKRSSSLVVLKHRITNRGGSTDAARRSIDPSLVAAIVTNSLREAREEIKHASEQAGRSIRQQLRSIDEGLEEQLDWG